MSRLLSEGGIRREDHAELELLGGHLVGHGMGGLMNILSVAGFALVA